MSVHGSEANRVVESEFGSVSLEETRIRSKRSVVKRRITTTLRKCMYVCKLLFKSKKEKKTTLASSATSWFP